MTRAARNFDQLAGPQMPEWPADRRHLVVTITGNCTNRPRGFCMADTVPPLLFPGYAAGRIYLLASPRGAVLDTLPGDEVALGWIATVRSRHGIGGAMQPKEGSVCNTKGAQEARRLGGVAS
jgi:hypothetical protein